MADAQAISQRLAVVAVAIVAIAATVAIDIEVVIEVEVVAVVKVAAKSIPKAGRRGKGSRKEKLSVYVV